MTANIGAFTLRHPLGRGGMGEVWQATHRNTDIDVALKVMTSDRADNADYRAAFRREVRAVASLNHPAVVRVLDCGDIPVSAVQASGGALPASSPYLVMELATGTLRDLDGQCRHWSQQLTVLLRILDGLNHAHVRGVIHRDLKPENVLIVNGSQGPTLKLADFGLAQAYRRPDESTPNSTRITGTPRFMAPEQILGLQRDQGPWTDLYALGCLAYWLIDGQPPYSGADTTEILAGHLDATPPPIANRDELPPGFEAWLNKMLAKAPSDRFRLAADAALALRQLCDSSANAAPQIPIATSQFRDRADRTSPTTAAQTLSMDATLSLPEMRSGHRPAETDDRPTGALPPMPVHWERPERPGSTPTGRDALRGVGLGLYGLRQIELIDRIEERDRLWEELRCVHRDHEPRAIALTGTLGVGKTRLARWLAARAQEVGAARTIEAHHSPTESGQRGLAHLLARLLRCDGLARDDIAQRIERRFEATAKLSDADRRDCQALTSLVAAVCDPEFDPKTQVRFSSPRERYHLITRFLHRIHDGRPLVMVLDDVQWGHDTLRFIEFLLTTADSPPPLFAVMTVRDQILASRPLEAQAMQRLQDHPHFDSLDVAPLTDPDHRRLVHTLLGLESDLYDEVMERTRGNPLFAIQLVGDWVERGILVAGERGFQLHPTASASLPADIQHLLEQRLQQLTSTLADADHRPESIWTSLELAAALGREVDLREWQKICELAAIDIAPDVVDALSRTRLIDSDAHSFIFSHGAIRECLEQHARQHDRWRSHHQLCAQALGALYPDTSPGLMARIGHHYRCAEQWDQAIAPLLSAADKARISSDFARAYELLDFHRDAINQAAPSDLDDRRARNAIRRARTYVKQARLPDASQCLDDIDQDAISPAVVAEYLFASGILARARGDVRAGIELAEQCREHYRGLANWPTDQCDIRLGHRKSIGLCADLLLSAGRLSEALQISDRYLTRCQQADHHNELAAALMQKGNILVLTGRHDAGLQLLERARQIFASVPNQYGVAQTENAIGEVQRMTGDTSRALDHYQKALDLLIRIGIPRRGMVRFNIALCLVAEAQFERAQTHFTDTHHALSNSDSSGYLGLVHLGLATCAGALGNWAPCRSYLDQAQRLLSDTGISHQDVAFLAHTLFDIADSTLHPDLRQRAAALAIDQYRRLDQPDSAREIEARVDEG